MGGGPSFDCGDCEGTERRTKCPLTVEKGNALSSHIVDCFKNLFTSEIMAPDVDMMNGIHPRVTLAMNDILLSHFMVEEIKKALFSIGDMKAPGLDGPHAIFYK